MVVVQAQGGVKVECAWLTLAAGGARAAWWIASGPRGRAARQRCSRTVRGDEGEEVGIDVEIELQSEGNAG